MPDQRPQLTWGDISPGDVVSSVTLNITLRRLILNAGACWDVFPGHFDREYARAQGYADVFANTSLLLALADRMVTDWAGPRTRIVRRSLTMDRPVHPGENLRASGLVTGRRRDGELHLIDMRTELATERGRCAHGATSLVLPAVTVPST
jgi:acyl dehydratase